jgi:PAS domain S-box-containing protein
MPDAKLLLVQDKTSSKEFHAPLKNLGYQVVDIITDGKQALKRIPKLQPDLVLISIHLNGELGGILIGKQIYNLYNLPVIYISDQSSQSTIQRSGGTAPFGYLFGKEDEKQILATIEVALARHKLEKKVRDSEQLLRKIAENYPNSYISVIEEDYTIGFTSGQEFKNQNLDPEQFIGSTLEQVWAENAGFVREHYEKTFKGEEQSFQFSMNNQHLDFKTIPLYSKDSSIHQILAVVENITKRTLAEQKLKESESWLNAILHSIGEGVIAVDERQCVRFINPVAESLIGKKNLDVFGEPLEEILPLLYSNSDERVTFSHAAVFLQDQNLRTGFEATLNGTDGIQTPLEVSISPISERDNHIGMVLSFRDISERKRSMREVQRHAMRSEAMLRAAEKLNARLDVRTILKMVCEICNNSIKTTATSAFLLDAQTNTLRSYAVEGEHAKLKA